MAAVQPLYLETQGLPARADRLVAAGHENAGVDLSGAAYGEAKSVKIDIIFCFELAVVQMDAAVHGGLLVCGEHALQSRMLGLLVRHVGHHKSHADAVITAQSGALRRDHVALGIDADGGLGEVVVHALVLDADHVAVGVENDG